MDWRKITLPDSATIEEGLNALNRSRAQILLVIDDELRLRGCVTDGDIRRQLLRNSDLKASIREAMIVNPITAKVESLISDKLKMLKDHKLVALPVLFENGRIHSVIHKDDSLDFLDENFCAVIMAGGKGSRLGVLTQRTPKPLLEVGGKSLLERSISHLAQEGFKEIFISINYLADEIVDFLNSRTDLGVELTFIREEIPLGTAGSLSLLPSRVRSKPILVTNSDLIHDLSFLALAEFHLRQKSDISIVTKNYKVAIPYGVLSISNNRVCSIEEKPSYSYMIGAGITIVSPEALNLIKKDTRFDMTDLFEECLGSNKKIMSFLHNGLWIDIGNPNDFALSQVLLSR